MAIYLKNCWYAAAFSDEVTRKPLARKLLDEYLVFYRKENGEAVILSDSCPHRFAPLSEGAVIGDDIRCPYHGLKFNSDGLCVDNPHNPGGAIPKQACIKSYGVAERYGVVWLWPGDPAKVDLSLIPDFHYLEEPEHYRLQQGYLYVKGNYQLVADNLLDLTHAPYIHPEFVVPNSTIENQLANTKTELLREGNTVTAVRLRFNMAPTKGNVDLFDFDPDVMVDTRSNMTWHPPALIKFDAWSWVCGTDPDEGAGIPQAHLITPETETTCHYFFIVARNRKRDDESVDAGLMGMLDKAFRTQDEPMIEAVQQRMGTGDLNSLNPVLLATDAAPMAARRKLEQLIAEERKAGG